MKHQDLLDESTVAMRQAYAPYSQLFVGAALRSASVIGWVVRHAHVHLVPTDAPGQVPGLDGPPWPAGRLAALTERLRTARSRDGSS